MMLKAKTPHLMQTHSGEIDFQRLENFVDSYNDIEDFQVLDFLNIEGSKTIIGEHSLAGSVQDNGLSVQSHKFDFLLNF